jgi:hypothetical protein
VIGGRLLAAGAIRQYALAVLMRRLNPMKADGRGTSGQRGAIWL